MGLDGTGQEHGIIIALDLGSGQPVGISRVPEHDVKALLNWLEPLVKACGVEVIVRLCRLPTYNLVAQACGLWPHRRTAGSRAAFGGARPLGGLRLRRIGRLIKTFEAELGEQVKPILDEVRRIIDELPQDGGKRRSTARLAWKSRPGLTSGQRPLVQEPLYRLKQFILRLSQQWAKYRLWLVEPGVPSTNNRTEQAEGPDGPGF